MFLFRLAFYLAIVVMLMPTDERQQARLQGSAGTAVGRAATFCERNPGTCAAGAELWATFLKKGEFALHLASNMAVEWMAKPEDRKPVTYGRAANPALAAAPSR